MKIRHLDNFELPHETLDRLYPIKEKKIKGKIFIPQKTLFRCKDVPLAHMLTKLEEKMLSVQGRVFYRLICNGAKQPDLLKLEFSYTEQKKIRNEIRNLIRKNL